MDWPQIDVSEFDPMDSGDQWGMSEVDLHVAEELSILLMTEEDDQGQ